MSWKDHTRAILIILMTVMANNLTIEAASALEKWAPNGKIAWIVRPVSPCDKQSIEHLLKVSFETLLPRFYSKEVLEVSLPLLTLLRPELLTCPTWYVVQHPSTGEIVGCGGWTAHTPKTDEAMDDRKS